MTKPPSEHTFEDLFVGQKVTFSEKIDESLLIDFAKLSGDFNPLHMDEDYALSTNFEKRVCHGMLLASFFFTVGWNVSTRQEFTIFLTVIKF